jgi:hypothetical protein
MLRSSLRRVIDLRLLPLSAALLLGGCALHRPDGQPDVAPTPANYAPALPHVELPDIDVPLPDDSLLDLMTEAPTTSAVTRWVTHAPSFVLVSTSEVASDHATAALQPTSVAFARLFGERAPRIAVAVVDTTNGRPLLDVPDPPPGMTSIVTVVSGLSGRDSAATAEALTSELRFQAATAWIFDYTADWREALGVPGVRPLPDWMQVALLRMLAGTNSAADDLFPAPREKMMSLDTLFTHRVSQREADAALSVVRSPANIESTLTEMNRGTPEWQHGLAFADESTRLLGFLRNSFGDRMFASIVGATAAGMTMPEILGRLPEPMTTAELNVVFQAWTNAKGAASTGNGR